ncbi:MAG: biotin carboxylase N-terminal domain-containing protein [Pseudomonadota bacterium]
MIRKLLIANRGEIAVRVARTARLMGIATVAVYSDADRKAPHVRACDEAVHIGGAAPTDSYLRIEAILDAIAQTGADAVHPGYGFLSENAEFAEALENAGVIFVGPTADTIRKMGSKAAAKDLMESAGVPTTPGYQGKDQSLDIFRIEAERIGYPVLLKATAGGGGKGMRRVDTASDLEEALASAQREARSAFGDDRFLIEKFVETARHVEVQIFGDGNGDVVHLFERDCSVQRRHQKIIEEAPAPNLPAKVRKALLQSGVEAGKAVDYRGAGTVEFLYDAANAAVYFMEMNTRLQVEHPVTEEITGVDLVEWQLRVASGEGLPLKQSAIKADGHAFEARLYAEDPSRAFTPSIGDLSTLVFPSEVRIDSGVEQGQAVTPFYDPMIAKIITRGGTRDIALARMVTALNETRIAGLNTNLSFLKSIASDDAFAVGDVSTRFLDARADSLTKAELPLGLIASAGALYSLAATRQDAFSGFRLNAENRSHVWLRVEEAVLLVELQGGRPSYAVTLTGTADAASRREGKTPVELLAFEASGSVAANGHYEIDIAGARHVGQVVPHLDGARIFRGADYADIGFPSPVSSARVGGAAEGSLKAPLPGTVTSLVAAPGDAVSAGDTLLVVEAMKMEHAIKAPQDGVLAAFQFKVGDQVREGDVLAVLEASGT